MYKEFFGFRELPFELTPDPRFLFLTTRHREALASLRHTLSTAKGLAVLVGEAGTGKTTVIRAALSGQTAGGVRSLYLNNPTLTRDEFVEFLARGFELSPAAATSKATMLAELERVLVERRNAGTIMALVIDEAQSLPYELLEEVRLLANIETETQKLLPVVLAGQPELADRLNEINLRQLKQRIALRCSLMPLTLHETASYVAARIRVAGGDCARVFTREAVTVIHQHSGGIPRTISVLCDNALVSAFALNRRPVSSDVVLEVCQDFDLKSNAEDGDETPAGGVVIATPRPVPALGAVPETPAADARDRAPAPRRRIFSFF